MMRHRPSLVALVLVLVAALSVQVASAALVLDPNPIIINANPFGVAVNPQTNRVYVTQGTSTGSVAVINGTNNTVIAGPISVGGFPKGVAVNSVTNKVYVASGNPSNSVSVISGTSNTVIATIALPSVLVGTTMRAANPFGVAVDTNANRIYVTNQGAQSVYVIDGTSDTLIDTDPVAAGVNPIPVGVLPAGVAVDAQNHRIYVAVNTLPKSVYVIDGTTNTVVGNTIPDGSPWGVALDPTGQRLYVTNTQHSSLTVYDTSSVIPVLVNTVSMGAQPSDVAVNTATQQVFVVNRNASVIPNVTVFDGTVSPPTPIVTHTVPTNLSLLLGVAVNPDTNRAYVAHGGAARVSVIYDDTPSGDTTPPVVTVPADMTEEATSSAGAVVNFSASAVDDVDGALAVTCTPPSGSTFPLGDTTVDCTATDAAGNPGTASFTVTVEDTTPPVVTVPAGITVAATSGAGAEVTFSTSATDIVDGTVAVTCTPPSGSTFPVGTTTVTCTATDAAGNPGSDSFTVTVQDTIAPVVSVPANLTVHATSGAGATVTFSVTATDNIGVVSGPTCTPPSGSTFPIGTTTVTCTATDAAGNTGTASFTATVEVTYDGLCALVRQYVSNHGIANSLCVKLRNAAAAEARGSFQAQAGLLNAFIHEVEALGGKKHLSQAHADILVQLAQRLLPPNVHGDGDDDDDECRNQHRQSLTGMSGGSHNGGHDDCDDDDDEHGNGNGNGHGDDDDDEHGNGDGDDDDECRNQHRQSLTGMSGGSHNGSHDDCDDDRGHGDRDDDDDDDDDRDHGNRDDDDDHGKKKGKSKGKRD